MFLDSKQEKKRCWSKRKNVFWF